MPIKKLDKINLNDVQAVYNGPEGRLWELIMGEQIHIGGFVSSMDLAERSNIKEGTSGIDFCCCNGAGMRFLVRFRGVKKMHGVDATETVIESGRQRCKQEKLSEKIAFTMADVCNSGLADASADFVWGKDAWCYVSDKEKLIAEAVRTVKPGGTIAFTDWLEGETKLNDTEAARYLSFMKFPNILDINEYRQLLEDNGCEVVYSEHTGRFAPYMDLYIDMLEKQLTYDALKIIDFNGELMQTLAGEMKFIQELAHAGKTVQGLFVAKKKE